VVSTPLKNMSQNGNLLQIGVKITNIWNHHPEIQWIQVIKLGTFGISARQPTSFHLPFLEGRGLRWEISTFPRRGDGRRMEKSRAPNWVLWRTASNILKHPKICQTLFHKSAFALQVLPSFSISWSCWSPAKLCLQLGICVLARKSHCDSKSDDWILLSRADNGRSGTYDDENIRHANAIHTGFAHSPYHLKGTCDDWSKVD